MKRRKLHKKLLIIQGGAVFGCIPARLLATLPAELRSLDRVTMLAGCSIGGILAAAYAAGNCFDVVDTLFSSRATDCFQKRFWAHVNPAACPTYDNSGLDALLVDLLGDMTIGQTRKIWPKLDMVIPALNLTDDRFKVYDNITGQDDDIRLVDIAADTSAAPSCYYGRDRAGKCMVDGGMIEVAPLLTAATALRSKRKIEFRDMDVLMIGTGRDVSREVMTPEAYNSLTLLGLAKKVIVPYVTLSNQLATEFWGRNLGFGHFNYFNPIETDGAMDDVSQIPDLVAQCDDRHAEFEAAWHAWMTA